MANPKVGVDFVGDTKSFDKAAKKYQKGLDNSVKKTKAAQKQVGVLGKESSALAGVWTGVLGPAIGAYGVAQIARGVVALGKLGAETKRMRASFRELARQAGVSGDDLLDALKTASMGSVSEMDLMLSANRAMMLGLGADSEKLARLMQVAAFRGRAMGLSVTQAFSDMTTGIGRKSIMILDNLGIVGLKMGKTTTQAELMEQVIVEGMKQIEAAGGLAADSATKFEALAAKMADIKSSVAEIAVNTGVFDELLDFPLEGITGLERTAAALETIGALTGVGVGAARIPPLSEVLGLPFDFPDISTLIFGPAAPFIAAVDFAKQFETEIGEGVADSVNYWGPKVGLEFEQQTRQGIEQGGASAVDTLQTMYDRLYFEMYRPEVTKAYSDEAYRQLQEVGNLMMLLGAETKLADLATYDWKQTFQELDDTADSTMRRLIWGLVPIDQRIELIKKHANEAGASIRGMLSYVPDMSYAAMQEVEAFLLKTEVARIEAARQQPTVPAFDPSSLLGGITQPSDTGWARTALQGFTGQMGDAWDEEARRWADVAARGKESPWAQVLDIPPDVMDEGKETIKAYAAQMQQGFYADPLAATQDKDAMVGTLVDDLKASLEQKAAENQLNEAVWQSFMEDPEAAQLLEAAGEDVTSAFEDGFDDAKDAGTDFDKKLKEIGRTWDKFEDKTITLTVETDFVLPGGGDGGGERQGGPLPFEAQRGANFIVPPGFPRDTYPLRVTSGERVIVMTPQQQAIGAGRPITIGPVYINNEMDMQTFTMRVRDVVGGDLE